MVLNEEASKIVCYNRLKKSLLEIQHTSTNEQNFFIFFSLIIAVLGLLYDQIQLIFVYISTL